MLNTTSTWIKRINRT